MERLNFKHTIPIQLRFNDFDALGHVNNSVYFSFYDLGKTSYFNEVMPEMVSSNDVGVVIANIQVSFLLPVYPNENVAVQTAVVEIGNKSFKLFQQLINVDTNEVKCICQTVMVGFDAKTKATKLISDEWRKAMIDYEGRGDLSKTV
ncbi:acyl-CoA thioesterase [uncultured Bacteroides sp.]|uniref:acyl-CoA thioesterase n=1 Tax=uncultured Bacteroides sp. TaxID=162156 RepID=UPI002AAB4ABD|nr:acyl-CoA thioesterase [uncultured Bacteroides sp.]